MDRKLVTISKFLAKHLRHAPEALGLTLQPGGWVAVDDLLTASERAGFPISYDELIECVQTNDKQRFAFDDTGDRIRANQGHSAPVDLQLTARQPPEILYHGTVERCLASILAEGLKKGKRHHVHLSADLATARKVGARRGKPIILEVHARKMHDAGMPFFVSANGVWLTDSVPVAFVTAPAPTAGVSALPADDISIRSCRVEDVASVLELWRQAAATPSVTDTTDDLRRAIVDSPAHVLVAQADGRLVGSIIGTFDGWRGNIYRLAVHPEYRRRGVARALLAEVERRLAGQGVKRITALVEKDHAQAMGFWEAVGYCVDERIVRRVRTI